MTTDVIASGASVMLGFRATNVRSFRDPFEFSMLSTSISEPGVPRSVTWREGGKPVRILPVAGVFGANASGKSNLLRVMYDMKMLVLSSFRANPVGAVPIRQFEFCDPSEREPSSFEIDLVLDGVRHEYGFRVTPNEVLEEWARWFPRGRPALIFHRVGLEVELGAQNKPKGRATSQLLRSNALFLSTAAQTSHPALLPLYEWFVRNLILAESRTRDARKGYTAELLSSPDYRGKILALLRAADLGISSARPGEMDPAREERLKKALSVMMGFESESDLPPDFALPSNEVRLTHESDGIEVEFDEEDESLGTLVWLALVGPIVEALEDGSVFLADELDASLHPALVRQLIRLFQDPETNPNRAQLLFNSHDTTLLGDSSDRVIGRDQVWFTEKTSDGASHLYPLSDMDPRKEEAIARRYLTGRYGAVPIISAGEFKSALTTHRMSVAE